MKFNTKYNLKKIVYLVIDPMSDTSATYPVVKGKVVEVNCSAEIPREARRVETNEDYLVEYANPKTNLKRFEHYTERARFYIESHKPNQRMFETKKEADKMAESLRAELLKEKREEKADEKKYRKEEITKGIADLKAKAKKLNIKL